MKTKPQTLTWMIKLIMFMIIGTVSAQGFAQTPTIPDGVAQEKVDKEKDLKAPKI
jgi:hypothetical protein